MNTPTDYQHFIDGRLAVGTSGARLERRSPGNDEVVSTYAAGTAADVDAAVAAAKRALRTPAWSAITGADRAAILTQNRRAHSPRRGRVGANRDARERQTHRASAR